MKNIVITLANNITLEADSIPQRLIELVKRDLILANPAYLQAEKYGYSTYGTAPYIHLFEQQGNSLILPRGYIYRLLRLIRQLGHSYIMQDNRVELPPVDFHSRIKLRDYQMPAKQVLIKYGNGGLVAPCGSGKTEIMLAVMADLKQPALWITHTKDLLEQVILRALQSFDGMTRDEIGIIAEGKVRTGPRLTVALVQTLSRIDLDPIENRFGSIFIDEGHHIAADSFLHPISQFPAKYRLWCSATPVREDGLTKVVKAAGGPILYTIRQQDLPTLIPRLIIVETGYTGIVDPDNYPGMLQDLTETMARNRLIVQTIAEEASGHFSLVLSDRIAHLEILQAMLKDRMPHATIELLTGSMPKRAREQVMEQARNKQIDILLATQLAREGLYFPHLDRLFRVTPKRASNAVEQEIGRIQRPCEHKKDAIVFDFWDVNNPVFKAQFWKRRAAYQRLGINPDFKNGIRRCQDCLSCV